MRSCGALFVRFLPSAPDVAAHDAVGDCDSDNAEKGNVELHAVFFDFRGDFVLRQEIGEIVAHADKKRVPEGGADSCVENECPDVHPCQSGGNGNELPSGREQAADESGNVAIFSEQVFGIFHFLLVEKEHVPPTAVDEAVDDRPSELQRQVVVDDGSECRAEGSEGNQQHDIHFAVGSLVGGGGYDEFGRQRHDGVFHHHQQKNHPIA